MKQVVVWFAFGWVLGTSAVTWLGTSVLCLGDPKFDSGCGGFDLYLLTSFILYTPLAALCIAVALSSHLAPGRRSCLGAGLMALTLASMGVSYVWDGFAYLLIAGYLSAAAALLVVLVARRRSRAPRLDITTI
jgi:hypothetical protein